MTNSVLRLPQVLKKTGLSCSTIYKWMADQKFPKQIELGGRTVGWLESDIEGWINQCLSKSRTEG